MALEAGCAGNRRHRGWRKLRHTAQIVAFFLFLVLFISSRRGGWPGELVNVPMRLDPLAMLSSLIASRTFLLGTSLALVSIGLALAFGRAGCGWLCPVGSLLDWLTLKRWRIKGGLPEQLRSVKYGLLLTILMAAAFTNLSLLVFDPLTLWLRTLTVSVWPVMDRLVTATEGALYQIPLLRQPVSAFDGVLRPYVLPPEPVVYGDTLLFALVFLGVIALNVVSERFWCRYLCPLGAFGGLLGKVSILRRKVNAKCRNCNACAQVCPTGTIDPHRGYTSDPGECTVCLKCLDACLHEASNFVFDRPAVEWNSYDPGRRQFLVSLGAAVAVVGLFRDRIFFGGMNSRGLRPPGVRENDLLSRCVRCGECIRACPTGAIQPSTGEGLWTPELVLRRGFCDYSCNACGQVCPVQAIPALTLSEKRQAVIGVPRIDEKRCLPFAEDTPCIVCEEVCPIPDKAIRLETVEVTAKDGRLLTLQRPYGIDERCIGCGICEYKCPVEGEAAIQVKAADL